MYANRHILKVARATGVSLSRSACHDTQLEGAASGTRPSILILAHNSVNEPAPVRALSLVYCNDATLLLLWHALNQKTMGVWRAMELSL